jgi:hypothetical protein
MVYSASTTLMYLLEHPEERVNARPDRVRTAALLSRFRWPTLRRSARSAEPARSASAATPDCGQLQSQGSLVR